jgi:hypothetical protein
VTLTRSQVLRVAAEAQVDPRTVRRYADGQNVRGLPAERIAAALVQLGLKGGPETGGAVPDGGTGGGAAEKGSRR